MLLNKSDSDVKSPIISLIKEKKIIVFNETVSSEVMSKDHKDLNFQIISKIQKKAENMSKKTNQCTSYLEYFLLCGP